MRLKLHGSLGDFVMGTGLPEAYYKLFGKAVHIVTERFRELWADNPYITADPSGPEHSIKFNSDKYDYMIYYPVRLFFEMTGRIVDRSIVHPRIYRSFERERRKIVMSDQAGWPTRRGYPFLNDLAVTLLSHGYEVVYMRNDNFRDCIGEVNVRQIDKFSREVQNPSNADMIRELGSAHIYIGYDSGYCQIAGALGTKSVMLSSSVPPINSAHDFCIYIAKECSGYCCAEKCEKMCLRSARNINEEIITAVLDS